MKDVAVSAVAPRHSGSRAAATRHPTFSFRVDDGGYHDVRQGIRRLETGLFDACLPVDS